MRVAILINTALEARETVDPSVKADPESEDGVGDAELPDCSSLEGDNGLPLSLSDVYYVKPMYPPGEHGRGSRLAHGAMSPGTHMHI